MGRDGWRIKVESQTAMTSDRENFYLTGTLIAYENGVAVKNREWDQRFKRDLM
ncbi:hypothetical protein D3C80_2146810 [compost metagenome]